jgi:membrane-associated phospholipid phosphatase
MSNSARASRADPHPVADDARLAAKQVIAGDPGVTARPWLGWISLVAFLLFVGDSFLVFSGALTQSFDLPGERLVQSIHWGPIATLMQLTNASGGVGQVVLGVVAVVGLFWYERRAGALLALGALASVGDRFLKLSFARHRPTADLVNILDPSKGYSYPSGHAVFFTWLAFMLAVALAPRLRPGLRWIPWAGAIVLIVIACLGRVWGGAHWPSDVIGGFLFALSWSAFVLWLPERWLPSPLKFFQRRRAA